MLKSVHNNVWVFDAEWYPDPIAGRLLYDLSHYMPDDEVIEKMFQRAGATEENPTPYLKPALCKVLSIVALIRKTHSPGKVSLKLLSLPKSPADSEREILHTFLDGIGKHQPQLVGYNSGNADMRVFAQRALINGVEVPRFFQRPEKPWLGPDYLAKENDYHVDLYSALHGWGAGGPSLHQIATLSGIPGKMDCDGQQVFKLALEGRLTDIIAYNECDVLSTYLLWLRIAHISGFVTSADYINEQEQLRELLIEEGEVGRGEHLASFLSRWGELSEKN
jgi:3'-5' exonuclease